MPRLQSAKRDVRPCRQQRRQNSLFRKPRKPVDAQTAEDDDGSRKFEICGLLCLGMFIGILGTGGAVAGAFLNYTRKGALDVDLPSGAAVKERPKCWGGRLASTRVKSRGADLMCVHNEGEFISDTVVEKGEWDSENCGTIAMHADRYAQVSKTKYWFLDVGANIGYLSLCGYQALPTLSIEAAPWNYKLVKQTRDFWHAHNPERPWYVVNKAVSMRSGENLSMVGNPGNYGGSTLVKPENHPAHDSGWGTAEVNKVNVTTETLSSIIDGHLPKGACIGVMKMDIEGYEYIAMRSFLKNLEERPPCLIITEYSTILLKAANSNNPGDRSALEFIDLLKSLGYHFQQKVPEKVTEDVILDLVLTLPPALAKGGCTCFGEELDSDDIIP